MPGAPTRADVNTSARPSNDHTGKRLGALNVNWLGCLPVDSKTQTFEFRKRSPALITAMCFPSCAKTRPKPDSKKIAA
jgi:hypothetical protein